MTIDDIKRFLEHPLIKKLKFEGLKPAAISSNKPILKIIRTWKCNFSVPEIFYLLKHKNELEKLNIFCPTCGKKNTLINGLLGYHSHCSMKCSANDDNIKNKIKNSKISNIDENGLNSIERGVVKCKQTRLNDVDENGLNSYQRGNKKAIESGKNNIDEFGRNSYKRGNIKGKQTKKERYDDETAKSDAAIAKSDAALAKTDAAAANSTANTANDTANEAKSTADAASTAAAEADSKAEQANAAAETAQTTADAAKAKADGSLQLVTEPDTYQKLETGIVLANGRKFLLENRTGGTSLGMYSGCYEELVDDSTQAGLEQIEIGTPTKIMCLNHCGATFKTEGGTGESKVVDHHIRVDYREKAGEPVVQDQLAYMSDITAIVAHIQKIEQQMNIDTAGLPDLPVSKL